MFAEESSTHRLLVGNNVRVAHVLPIEIHQRRGEDDDAELKEMSQDDRGYLEYGVAHRTEYGYQSDSLV